MADGIQITPGSGALVGADSCTVNSVANTYVQLVKLGFGVNDSFTYVASGAGLPVAQQGTWNVGLTGVLPAGTNAIGHVVVDTMPTVAVTGTFWQATQPVSVASLPPLAAGTNTVGAVNAIQAGDSVQIAGTTYAVQRAFANATASGNTQVVGATGGKKVRVLKYTISTSAAVNVFFDGTTSGALSSTKYLAGAGAGVGAAFCPFGQFADTGVNEALQINLSTTANVGVDVLYILV